MRALADANWLVAAYFANVDAGRTEVVKRLSKRWEIPILISPVVHLECQNVFASLGGEATPKEWKQFQADIGTRLVVPEISWESIGANARELFQRFSHKARVGTLDMMILASALKCDATHLLSFDTNSNLRALAAVLKLKVFPELTADDKRRMAAFR